MALVPGTQTVFQASGASLEAAEAQGGRAGVELAAQRPPGSWGRSWQSRAKLIGGKRDGLGHRASRGRSGADAGLAGGLESGGH